MDESRRLSGVGEDDEELEPDTDSDPGDRQDENSRAQIHQSMEAWEGGEWKTSATAPQLEKKKKSTKKKLGKYLGFG